MLTMFAPRAVIPPSPYINPCNISTIDKTNTAAQGLTNIIAINAAPTIWPLVPQGMGTFMACMANMPAAKTARSGMFLSSRFSLAHLREYATTMMAIIQ